MIDDMSRPFAELSDSGILWAINRALFHPRGFALALCRDGDGHVTGWRILGDGTEPWVYEPSVSEDQHFADFEATLRTLRTEAGAPVEHVYTVTAHDKDGRQAAVTIGPVEGAVRYNEYWTGPSPWWKRIWRRR